MKLHAVVKWFGLQRGDSLLVISHTWFLLKRFMLISIALASIFAVIALMGHTYLLAISGTISIIIVIVCLDTGRNIRSNIDVNRERQHVLMMMLKELYSMRGLFERGRRAVYEDENGKVGFVDEILTYDWCDRLSARSVTSFDVIISQVRIHDIVNLAKDHNRYRQKLEDVVVPNRVDGVLPDEEAGRVRSYCELLQESETELVRVLLEVTDKGQDLLNSIGINICKNPDSISP